MIHTGVEVGVCSAACIERFARYVRPDQVQSVQLHMVFDQTRALQPLTYTWGFYCDTCERFFESGELTVENLLDYIGYVHKPCGQAARYVAG
jgi:hypothetical protein